MPFSRFPDSVRRVFTESFTARDVAEPLLSFDMGTSAGDVLALMEARGFDVAVKRLEQLRNNLAHAQDILSCDWETIVQLAEVITQQ
jgi:hypothetical protein